MQLVRTRTESVAADLNYDYNNGQTLFNDASFTPFMAFANNVNAENRRLNRVYNHGIFMAGVRARIIDGTIPVDYAQLADEDLAAGNTLIGWLGSGHHEHMWINLGGQIKVARRNDEKLPHPTLAGGDPNVVSAGLLNLNEGARTVTVSNASGHFQPEEVGSSSRDLFRAAVPRRYRLPIRNI